MLEALKRLLSPEYLAVVDPGPMGGGWLLYLALGTLFLAGLGAAAWLLLGPGRNHRSRGQRIWAWFELWVCLAGLGTVAGRFLGWPGWSARIWPFSLAALAIAGACAYGLRRLPLPGWMAAELRVLALLPQSRCPRACAWRRTDRPAGSGPAQKPGLPYLLRLLLHLAGIGLVVAGRYGAPPWVALVVLPALLLPQAPLVARRCRPRLTVLTPLLAAYAATLLWLLYQAWGITVIGWQGLTFPNPMISLFYVDGIVLAAVVYVALCQLAVVAVELSRPAVLWRGAAIGLLLVTLAWAGVVYLGKRTHGVTASDPYAYAQMGVDLAERGTFLHRLSLFQEVMPLHIAWAPLQPVGYHIPRNELGDSPSVWATGASVLLAAGYLLMGETGLYVTTPIVALLGLVVVWALAQETLRGEPRSTRWLTGALTVALVATSPEHVDRLLVPMADATALLLTTLAVVLALRGMNRLGRGRSGLVAFFLAGLCLGWAFWVRHTQLVLLLPGLLAIALGCRQRVRAPQPRTHEPSAARRTAPGAWACALAALAVFLAGALLGALPDIVYRWRVFGGPLATETTELPLMAFHNVGPVAWQMLREALAAGEWGYLFPLALLGGYSLARRHTRQAAILGCTLAAVLLVHFTYRSLRLRDLISIFPLLDLAVAWGAVTVVHGARSIGRRLGHPPRLGRALLPVAAIGWVVLTLALSRWAMIDNLWKPGWASFGYMRAEHRAAFSRLAALTPPEAIIGASLNAGAVMLYTGREAIRPYDSWTDDEWQIFLDAMRAGQRPVYLLDDGGLMAPFIAEQQTRRRLTPVEELAVPIFNTQDRLTGWLYRLEED